MNYIIVTNTYNRPFELVTRSLKASLQQKIEPIAVFLIDQNEKKLELPEYISKNKIFHHLKTDKRSVSSARNSLEIPENVEWIFFCDDDGYPHPGYSEILREKINSNPGIEILAGSIVRTDNQKYYSLRHLKGGSLKYFRNTKKLFGSNFVIKTEVFKELGRFDENFGVGSFWGSSEETDFCWNAYFAGKKMEFFKELIVYHVPPFNESLKTGFKKAFMYGVGKGALVWKWLIKKRKIKVVYELVEMFIVPFIQMLNGIIKLKFQMIPINFAILTGRMFGLIKAAFTKW